MDVEMIEDVISESEKLIEKYPRKYRFARRIHGSLQWARTKQGEEQLDNPECRKHS